MSGSVNSHATRLVDGVCCVLLNIDKWVIGEGNGGRNGTREARPGRERCRVGPPEQLDTPSTLPVLHNPNHEPCQRCDWMGRAHAATSIVWVTPMPDYQPPCATLCHGYLKTPKPSIALHNLPSIIHLRLSAPLLEHILLQGGLWDGAKTNVAKVQLQLVLVATQT